MLMSCAAEFGVVFCCVLLCLFSAFVYYWPQCRNLFCSQISSSLTCITTRLSQMMKQNDYLELIHAACGDPIQPHLAERYHTYLVIENKMDFTVEELNDLELCQFVIFRSSYSEVPKLIRPTVPNPSCSITAGANKPIDAFKKGIKHGTSLYAVLKNVHFFQI